MPTESPGSQPIQGFPPLTAPIGVRAVALQLYGARSRPTREKPGERDCLSSQCELMLAV